MKPGFVADDPISERIARQAKPETLEKIARLYDIIADLNACAAELRAANIEVYVGGVASKHDPLAQKAVVRVTFHPEIETLR